MAINSGRGRGRDCFEVSRDLGLDDVFTIFSDAL
jgi:hypothetical protein